MDDFKRQFEQAKLARMQGIRPGQPPATPNQSSIPPESRHVVSPRSPLPPVGTPKNRIEEALGRSRLVSEPSETLARRPVEAVRPSPAAVAPIVRPVSDVRRPVTSSAAPVVSAAKIPTPITTGQEASGEVPKSNKGYGKFLKRFFLGLFLLIILGALAFVGRTYLHVRSTRVSTAADVIAAVGKLVDLPQGETPTVATISDLKPLAGEAFFKDAAIGDKVLIFATSSKAILYRPSTNKVIQVSPLNK